MDFYFVYSSGGGAGDWNGINRVFPNEMPPYFKNHILLKFGDIFFNHRSSKGIIKSNTWRRIRNARTWIIDKTTDPTLLTTPDMIMDVGSSKLVSYITSNRVDISEGEVIQRFDDILQNELILEKYCEVIRTSGINNAVTFDIPNLFKVRTQTGNVSRRVFSSGAYSRTRMLACANYANKIHSLLRDTPECVMTYVDAHWTIEELHEYLSRINYPLVKIAVGGLTDFSNREMGNKLTEINTVLDFSSFDRVHFLGAGGLDKARTIKKALGNHNNFSADNTTAFNRGVDGKKNGTKQSGYYDYTTKTLHRITPTTIDSILTLHQKSEDIALFTVDEMRDILQGILLHQSGNSSPETYECRGKLIIHNFDVYRVNAQ